jgi:uncharacterized protein
LLVDTGVLLAAADSTDRDHVRCSELLRQHSQELFVPIPVIPETSWQIERILGPNSEAAFLRLITSSVLKVVEMTFDDWNRCIELIETYSDLGLGLVDASIVALAERSGIETIATLNHRDFPAVRPSHCDGFRLLP